METPLQPQIVEYGPIKVIGIARACKTSADCEALWMEFGKQVSGAEELQGFANGATHFGICRCVQGPQDGSFEYIAAIGIDGDASLPQGWMEFTLPSVTYAQFAMSHLNEIGAVWKGSQEWLSTSAEWQGYCDGNEAGCGCIDTPSFELYPPGFDGSQGLFIYIPVKSKAK